MAGEELLQPPVAGRARVFRPVSSRPDYSCSVPAGKTIYTGAENIFQNNLYDRVVNMGREARYDWNSDGKIAKTTVQGWMNSPGHRKNILTPFWRSEGIGIAVAPDDKVYITAEFLLNEVMNPVQEIWSERIPRSLLRGLAPGAYEWKRESCPRCS